MRIANPIARLGEDIATTFLQKKGYKILERNVRSRYEEIDIVALYQKSLVFIEVKTRSSHAFGTPLEGITSWKLKSLIKAAQYYKHIHPKLPETLRIDAIAVDLDTSSTTRQIEHIENISGF